MRYLVAGWGGLVLLLWFVFPFTRGQVIDCRGTGYTTKRGLPRNHLLQYGDLKVTDLSYSACSEAWLGKYIPNKIEPRNKLSFENLMSAPILPSGVKHHRLKVSMETLGTVNSGSLVNLYENGTGSPVCEEQTVLAVWPREESIAIKLENSCKIPAEPVVVAVAP